MTNKYIYFIANWKMFGGPKSLNLLNKVIKFSKIKKNNKFKLIYCPPYTLINLFYQKLKNTNIDIGGQNCHENEFYGPFTGSINSKMIKESGAKYIIIGHSENRENGDTNLIINKKIKSSLKNNLKVIFCIGETSSQRKKKLTYKILMSQIKSGLKNIKDIKNIFFAYEPVWSIGTGILPEMNKLEKDVNYIKTLIKKNYRVKNPKILYGGSVKPQNINNLKEINALDGFLIGGASHVSKKFIDIVKKTFI